VHSCCVYVLEGEELVLRAWKNLPPEALAGVKLRLPREGIDWVSAEREPAVVPRRAGADARFKLFNQMPEDYFASFVSVPLVSRGCLVGVINVQNREPYHYSQREIVLLSMVGFLLGAEVGMARLEEQNAKLSLRLESRTLVERAKGILQSELAITESAAYQRLQRQSQQMRKSMKEIAEAIVVSHAVKGERQ
jgi:uroporphyrinogen-III synthase